MDNKQQVKTIEHSGVLDDVVQIPAYLTLDHRTGHLQNGVYSCCFCGVGDNGFLLPKENEQTQSYLKFEAGVGQFTLQTEQEKKTYTITMHDNGTLDIATKAILAETGGIISGELNLSETKTAIALKENGRAHDNAGNLYSQRFIIYRKITKISEKVMKQTVPTTGCVKLNLSLMRQRPLFPVHIAPSVLDHEKNQRQSLTYQQGIEKFADLLLAHRKTGSRTLVYACGQIDYFTIFAMQEVFRLLGIRNLTGNAEHCLNAGAVHNEVLTGQEGPFLTVKQSIEGAHRFYLLNGWNGFITHPPVFSAIIKRKDCDAYLIEVMVSESAKAIAKRLDSERVILLRPRSDPHFALAVTHEILKHHSAAIEKRFIDYFSDIKSYETYIALAESEDYALAAVAKRIAPEAQYVERIEKAIKNIAAKLADPQCIPINIPSVGLSQTSGIVTHCLWGNLLALLGKYGLNADGSVAGGTLRIPGQINAETEVQGLSRKYFMGRIPMTKADNAARRMGLPDNAYDAVLKDTPRTALDYSDPTPEVKECFLFFGTHFEANMMNRKRMIRKLTDPDTRFIVIDPLPDPFSVEHADLIIPSPPHPATTKLYQNGEWKLSLSIPQKQAAPETRSDPTIIYDVMSEIAKRLQTDSALAEAHPDLASHLESGYLQQRFMPATEIPEIPQSIKNTPIMRDDMEATVLQKSLYIGRDPSNEVVLTDIGISRKHAVLLCVDREKPSFMIKDLDSANGLFKNGEKIKQAEFDLNDDIKLNISLLRPEYFLPLFGLQKAINTDETIPQTTTTRGLVRIDGEVSRPQLWQRILDYQIGENEPLYCTFYDKDKQPILWKTLLEKGSEIYGGVGTTRYKIDYEQPDKSPYADVFGKPRLFTFFTPTASDIMIPEGIILNSGRSALSDEREKIRFATSTFNSGKATPALGMPDEHPLHISPILADRYALKTGDYAKIIGRHSGGTLISPVLVTDRVKGESIYLSFHKSRGQIEKGNYINNVTSHYERCTYCAQTRVKANLVRLEKVGAPLENKKSEATAQLIQRTKSLLGNRPKEIVDTTLIDATAEIPLWEGKATPLYITDIIKETHDVFTFRFQGNPLCRFVYMPGQFCTLHLMINGKKVLRSYTISSTPSRPYVLEVTIKRVPGGLISNWLPDNLEVGDEVIISGPKGKFILTPGKIPKKILFLTGGSGITPLMSMSRWLSDISANVDVKFLNSVRSPNDIIFKKEMELMTSRYKMFEPIVITATHDEGSDWIGMSGHIDYRMLDLTVPDYQERHVFLCGPPGFMDAMKAILQKMNFDMTHFYMESFGGLRTSAPETAKTKVIKSKVDIPHFQIEFARSGKIIEVDNQTPLLELAEDHDVDIDYSCRSGSCGECKVRLLKGEVVMECEDGLDPADKEKGYILTCVGMAKSDCLLDT